MSASFMSYTVQIISIYLTWILQPLQFDFVSFGLIVLNILLQTKAYAA
jgi:hypothetical protein